MPMVQGLVLPARQPAQAINHIGMLNLVYMVIQVVIGIMALAAVFIQTG